MTTKTDKKPRRPRKGGNYTMPLNMDNFALAVGMMGFEMHWDVRKRQAVFREEGGDAQPCNDLDMARLNLMLTEQMSQLDENKEPRPWKLGKDAFYRYRDAYCSTRRRDMFLDWLLALPAAQGSDDDLKQAADDYDLNLDRMLLDCLGAEDKHYNRHISRMICLSAVARAMQPGYKIDEVPVIKGPQGAGKDTLLSGLLPEPEWSTQSLAFNMTLKERVEIAQGKVLVIASEMAGVTTSKDMEALKSYITTTQDDVRLAYRRDPEDGARRYTFLCTTNLDKPLPEDPSGNRRWCVVEVKGATEAVEPWIEKRREGYWAEALWLWNHGYRPNLPRDFKEHQSLENQELARHDEQVSDAFDMAETGGALKFEPQTLTEIAVSIGLAESAVEFQRGQRQEQHRLRNELLLRGWINKKGRKSPGLNVQRLWWPPESATYAAQARDEKTEIPF